MSWRWSRLSILTFLVLLYAAPLSTGDKGLWLSVAGLPVQALGTAAEQLPAEYASLLPDYGPRVWALVRAERESQSFGPGDLAGTVRSVTTPSRSVGETLFQATPDTLASTPSAPRGPPA
jgi:hypothetical protein